MKNKFDLTHLFIFVLVFIIMVVIGTLSHEIGHIIVARILGYETTLHYNRMDFGLSDNPLHELLMLSGGPIQTIGFGMIGFLILFVRRNHIKTNGMTLIDWLSILLSLFWSREVFNLLHSGMPNLLGSYNDFGGDEGRISELLFMANWVLPLLFGIVGLTICFYVVFRILPLKYRFNFISGGLIGSIVGYLIWFKVLGPYLLP
jgi:hypothetical protein